MVSLKRMEAVDHYAAVLWIRGLTGNEMPIDEGTVRELHRRIVARSQPEIAGVYSNLPRRIAGSPVNFPNAVKIPELMRGFGELLGSEEAGPPTRFDALFRLVAG